MDKDLLFSLEIVTDNFQRCNFLYSDELNIGWYTLELWVSVQESYFFKYPLSGKMKLFRLFDGMA